MRPLAAAYVRSATHRNSIRPTASTSSFVAVDDDKASIGGGGDDDDDIQLERVHDGDDNTQHDKTRVVEQDPVDGDDHSIFAFDNVRTGVLGIHSNGWLYRHGRRVLLPAPSPDPKDPLRLCVRQKTMAVVAMTLFGATCAAAEIILGAALPVFALFYAGIDPRYLKDLTDAGGLPRGSDPLRILNELPNALPIAQIYLLASLPILIIGLGNFVLVPVSIAVGRRPILLLSGVIAIGGAIWSGFSQSIGSHLAGRCFQAIGAGTIESLIPLMIQDMTFVHQRNTAISAVFAGQGVLIVGLGVATPYIIYYQSWRWVYFYMAIASGVFLVFVFCFVPETKWKRSRAEMNGYPQIEATQQARTLRYHQSQNSADLALSMTSKTDKGFQSTTEQYTQEDDKSDLIKQNGSMFVWKRSKRAKEETTMCPVNDAPKRTFAYNIKLFHDKPNWRAGYLAIRDVFRTFFYPQVFFITMLNSTVSACMLAAVYTTAPALITAPYSWPFLHLGFSLFAVLVGSLTVYLVTGPFADAIANTIARRTGARTAETQILNLILPVLTSIAGAILFGLAGSYPDTYPWPVFVLALTLTTFGFLAANSIGAVYVLESYPQLAGPALVNISSFRCILAFLLSFKVSDWIASIGYAKSFAVYASIEGFLLLLLPVVYFYGAAWRRRWPADWVEEENM